MVKNTLDDMISHIALEFDFISSPTDRYLQLDQTSQIIKCSRLNFLNIIVSKISKIDEHTLWFNSKYRI